MAEKRFIKGLFKDTGHIDQPEGTWRYALNAFINDKEGSISNEGGTWPEGELPKINIAGIGLVEHWLVIGRIRVDENRVVFFLKDQRKDTTTFTAHSAIVIWDADGGPGYVNNVKMLYNDEFLMANSQKGLNFDLDYLIEGTFKIDSRENLIIYWTDDLNPPRAFNITRQEVALTAGSTISEIYGIDYTLSHFDHIDLLNLFPNSGPVPHIEFFTVYSDPTTLANGEQNSVTHGGGLLTGVYYLALAYTDEDFVSTNFLVVSNPVSIVTEYDHTRPTFRKDGAKDGSQTSKAINWKVSNLNTDYKYLKPVVIRKMGDAVDAFRLSDVDVTVAAINGVVFSGLEGFVKSSISDVIIDTVSYDTAKTINQLDGVLYLGNLTGTKDLGYQKYANNIKLTAITKSIPDFDEFWATTDNFQTGFQSRPVDNGNYVDDSKSYRFDTNIFQYKGYMRDETYAFYIAFIMKDGSTSYAYHIPGRTSLSVSTADESLTMDSSGVAHTKSLGELNKDYAKKFHFYDYSALAGTNMNYWQNATEYYPNTENYEVWDPAINLTAAASSIQGLNVRHHHFPSNENDTFETIRNQNLSSTTSTGTSGTLDPINGRIVMFHRCKTWDEMYLGTSYCGNVGHYFPNQHSATNLPTSLVNTLISQKNNSSGGCSSGCGKGLRTVLTANQPMTVRTNYLVYIQRSCVNRGGWPTKTRIESNTSITTLGASHRQEDTISGWMAGNATSNCYDTNYNTSLEVGGTSVIQLNTNESIWINSKTSSNNRCRQGHCDACGGCPSAPWSSGYFCQTMDDAMSAMNSQFGTGTYNSSLLVFDIESGPPGLNASDLRDTQISHDVQRLGFRLSDIKIPKSIADKVQGFRVYYAERTHANKTILGQSTLNPMYLEDTYLGRCQEVATNANMSNEGLQVMAQLQSLPEIFWSKDPWPRPFTDYPLYNIPQNLNAPSSTNGYKAFAFHDFHLLRTKNSLAAATHIKPIYHVANLAWNGPGLEQDRRMLTQLNNAGNDATTALSIKEYWGWDENNNEQNCYPREILSAIFIGGVYDNMKYGSTNYEYPRLLGQKAKMYLRGDSIFKGQNLGFGGKLFNEFGESCMVFGLKDQHELPTLSNHANSLGIGGFDFGVDMPGAPAVLTNWDLETSNIHKNRSQHYLVNLHAFKTDLYKSIDNQKLIWTGFEVLSDDLQNYVFDDDTGSSAYPGVTPTFSTITTHPDGIWGGDTFINRYGYLTSITPNNEITDSNPKKALYHHIVESQDNINYRHFESDESLYFPATPAKTLLKYGGSSFNEGADNYDYSSQGNLKYNKNYSELNDLRTAFPLPLREVKQTEFPTRTHRSAKADPTSLIDNWRMYLANNYKDLPKNRGELWKLSSFNNLLYFHMEESLFAAKGKQSMEMKDGSEAFVGSGDIFQQEPDEIIQTKSGYGGTQAQWAALTTRAGYFFVDRRSRKVFLMQEKLLEISKVGMNSWFRENLKFVLEDYGMSEQWFDDNPLTGFGLHSIWDPKYRRIILTKREFVPTQVFINNYVAIAPSQPTASDVGIITFNPATGFFEEWIVYGASNNLYKWQSIQWHDARRFKSGGWTISYSPELNVWLSFHSYVPYLYFNTSTDFYSFSDKFLDYVDGTIAFNGVALNNPSALFTTAGNAHIWKHNEIYKGLIYKNYNLKHAPRYSFEIEYIENAVKSIAKTFYNISYTLENFTFNSATQEHDINVFQHGFTNYYVYNTHQLFSSTITAVGISGLEYLVNVRQSGSEWKINGFRDYANLAVQSGSYYMSTSINVIGGINVGTSTTSHINKMFTINLLGEHYTEDLNFAYIDTAKTWDQLRKFTDKWAGIRLIYNNIENNLLNLYSTEVGSRKYLR